MKKSAKQQVIDAGMACVEAIEWGIREWGEETLLTNWHCACRVDDKSSVLHKEKYGEAEVYGRLDVTLDKHGKEQFFRYSVSFDTEIVPKKNNNGFLIKVILWTAKTRFDTRRTQIFYKKMSVVVNTTPKGVRYFCMFEGKKYFGMHCISRAARAIGGQRLRWIIEKKVYEKINQKIQLLDIFPELKWFKENERAITWAEAMHPFLLNTVGSNAGAKAMINIAYSPKGEKRIQKDSFGGVGEIRTIGGLLNALLWARALRQVDPATMAKFSNKLPRLIGDEEAFKYNTFETNYRYVKCVDQLFWYFGVSEKTLNLFVGRLYDEFLMSDAVLMYRSIRSRRIRNGIRDYLRRNNPTMEEFHNFIAAEHGKIQQENKKISNKQLQVFEGKVNEEILCVIPKMTHDLVDWGTEYNICIGSYTERVFAGDTYCMGFRKTDGTFWGFAEVSREMELKQLLGKHNQPLPNEQRTAIEAYLNDKGVTIPSNYWGNR